MILNVLNATSTSNWTILLPGHVDVIQASMPPAPRKM
jgi:hypothetical protein